MGRFQIYLDQVEIVSQTMTRDAGRCLIAGLTVDSSESILEHDVFLFFLYEKT